MIDWSVPLYLQASKTCQQCGVIFHNKRRDMSQWEKRTCCSLKCSAKYRAIHKGELPDDATLKHHYDVEGMGGKDIAKKYDVDIRATFRRLATVGTTRCAKTATLERRGVSAPTKSELESMIHEKLLSYAEIARIFGVDRTMVSRWVKKQGIQPIDLGLTKVRSFIARLPDPETLAEMYGSGLSLETIASHFDITAYIVARLCNKYGIKIRKSGFPVSYEYRCLNGVSVRSSYELRVGNWLIRKGMDFQYEPRIPGHPLWKSDFLANGHYVEIWGVQDSEKYEERKREKISWYTSYGIPYIGIEFTEVRNKKLLESILSPCISNPPTPRLIQGTLF